MKRSRILAAACAACLGAATSALHAATYTFDGHSGTDSNWSNGSNWVGDAAPTNSAAELWNATDIITLGAGASAVNVDVAWGSQNLNVAPGTTYTLTGESLGLLFNVNIGETAKLYVNNTLRSQYGTIYVGNNSVYYAKTTLGGIGTVDGNVAMNTTGWPDFGDCSIIAPGDPAINGGIGTLTITKSLAMSPSGAGFHFAFGAAGNSQLAIGESLQLEAGTAFTITDLGGVQPGVYDLITYNGAAIDPAKLGAEQLNLPEGWSATLVSSAGRISLDVTATSVPEPVSLGLVAAGAMGMLVRRRCRA